MKVFLSSTAQDLVAYRQVADDTILRLSQQSVSMERFGPLPGTPVEECERLARECDVLICIIAHRYGFEPEKGRGSMTRREVEAAKTAGKDVLVWILADDHPWAEKKESDLLNDPTVLADPARVAAVVAGVSALSEFKAWLRSTFVCDTFTTPQELGRKIAVTLSNSLPRRMPESGPRPTQGESRIVHALQPAPHFHGREGLLRELTQWVADAASPDRVWSLVAAGGTGKTAIVERVIREMQPGQANVLVWSFYERPEADAFLRECNHLFLGEEDGPAGGRLERLERGLRDGRPHLIVLDGLERVQEDAASSRVRGELSDQTLKLLLRVMAGGLGRARALITSRFPLVDLQDWEKRGYRDTRLDDLTPEAAVAVLRGWNVVGEESALRAAVAQVGHHALSVAVIGSYLRSFAGGRVEAVNDFALDSVTGDDPKAAKLARVLGYYAERLPAVERELLARLSVFPRGVALDLLTVVIDAGGEVAGLLVNAKPRLLALLESLRHRGLLFEYRSGATITWTAHPFLRERFRALLGCPPERVFEVVADAIGAGVDRSPDTFPCEQTVLDRYERLIEATRLAGRAEEAYDLFQFGLGGFSHLSRTSGGQERGHRILVAFNQTGRPEDFGAGLTVLHRLILSNSLSLFAFRLGRLAEGRRISSFVAKETESIGETTGNSTALQNSGKMAFALGFLAEAWTLATKGWTLAELVDDDYRQRNALADRAIAAHAFGDVAAARADFALLAELERQPPVSQRGANMARHYVDLGNLEAARALADGCLRVAQERNWNDEASLFHALLARIDLAQNVDPTAHLDDIRTWTANNADMEFVIEAHHLSARHLLARGDTQAALDEAETGLVHAVGCGYRLLRIELLVALARIRLAWPDPPRAIQAARAALDLTTHPDCQYAWGEADAAQVWGEAYFANHEPELAHRAFTQALAVRKRIEHPGVAETERWLAMVEG